MELEDSLRVCLLALESRYPCHVVDIDEAVFGTVGLKIKCWRSPHVIAYLEQTIPELLNAMAHLVVDSQKSEIYLVGFPQERPAIVVHCQGKIPLEQMKVSEIV